MVDIYGRYIQSHKQCQYCRWHEIVGHKLNRRAIFLLPRYSYTIKYSRQISGYMHCVCLHTINTLRSRQNAQHLADVIFRRIFLNENCFILIRNSLKLVPTGPANNNPVLVQVMAWRWQAIIWTNDSTGYQGIYAALGLNEFRNNGLYTICPRVHVTLIMTNIFAKNT